MTAAAIALILAYVASLIVRALLAIRYAASLPDPAAAAPLPPGQLTVVQAILSGDPLLESCLKENLDALPGQRFLWMIDEGDDEAILLTDQLRREGVDAIRCPPCPSGANPKVWKLQLAEPAILTPFLAVIDDDTVLSAASAAALVDAAERATVATGLPCYLNSGNMTSRLLAQFVNNQSAFAYLGTAHVLPPFTLNGMGYAMRRSELDRLGGFAQVLGELTDDLAMATLVLRSGGTIHQSRAPLIIRTGVRDCRHYCRLMHRWHVFALLLLRRQSWRVRWLVAVLHGLPPVLFAGAIILSYCVSLWLLALVLAVRLLTIREMHRRFFGGRLHRPFVSIVSELLQPFHLAHAGCCRVIHWRGQRYRVRDTDDFSPA